MWRMMHLFIELGGAKEGHFMTQQPPPVSHRAGNADTTTEAPKHTSHLSSL